MKDPIRIAITGGAGQIAYNLLFRLASGEVFGQGQPVALHILELPQAMEALEGVALELEDCAYPLLTEVRIGSNPMEIFARVHWALLVGAKPRGAGMERKDLLQENGKIFVAQGKALGTVADPSVRVLVVGNPCNTNAWITLHAAPTLVHTNVFAMTRLDENRARAKLAQKGGTAVSQVTNMAIWGNHSTTQVPDFAHAKIFDKPAMDHISDRAWLEGPFVDGVSKRGAEIIRMRGKSSAASAANGIVNTLKSLVTPTPEGEWFSLAVPTRGNPYGIDEDMIFSFPCRSSGNGDYQIVEGLTWDSWLEAKIRASEHELQEERAAVESLLT